MKKYKALIPEAVAESISQEHSKALMIKFKRIINLNKQFAKKISDTEIGRDRLYVFMQHWFDAYNKTGKWM